MEKLKPEFENINLLVTVGIADFNFKLSKLMQLKALVAHELR